MRLMVTEQQKQAAVIDPEHSLCTDQTRVCVNRRVREVGKAPAWKEEERKKPLCGVSVDEFENNLQTKKSVTQVFVDNQEATSLSVNPPTRYVSAR